MALQLQVLELDINLGFVMLVVSLVVDAPRHIWLGKR
jgi:hypothetical protein